MAVLRASMLTSASLRNSSSDNLTTRGSHKQAISILRLLGVCMMSTHGKVRTVQLQKHPTVNNWRKNNDLLGLECQSYGAVLPFLYSVLSSEAKAPT